MAVIRLLPDVGVDADQAVRRALGVVLLLVAIVMLGRVFAVRERILPERWRQALQGRGTIAAGAIVGALVGFTSVGSGALLVPFLMSVFPLSPARVVGTDVFHAALLVSATGLAHAHGGTVDWPLVVTLLAGSIPGISVGYLDGAARPGAHPARGPRQPAADYRVELDLTTKTRRTKPRKHEDTKTRRHEDHEGTKTRRPRRVLCDHSAVQDPSRVAVSKS